MRQESSRNLLKGSFEEAVGPMDFPIHVYAGHPFAMVSTDFKSEPAFYTTRSSLS
jgi:hypothetical protein